MAEHDYSVCAESRDGKHEPRIALMQDSEMPEGYVTLECSNCFQTTGYFLAIDPKDVDW